MARLGINQELEVLFNRVLNKPEHERKVHYFGDCAFSFTHMTEVKAYSTEWRSETHQEHPCVFYSLVVLRDPNDWFSGIEINTTYKGLRDLIDAVSGKTKVRFRDALTTYLKKIELTEKLDADLKPADTSKKINKI